MAFIDDVKKRIRISHTKLDTEVQAAIDTAKNEMERAGIIQTKLIEADPLIATAIKTYCQYEFASDDKAKEGFLVSWQYQLENLRRSAGYGYEVDDV